MTSYQSLTNINTLDATITGDNPNSIIITDANNSIASLYSGDPSKIDLVVSGNVNTEPYLIEGKVQTEGDTVVIRDNDGTVYSNYFDCSNVANTSQIITSDSGIVIRAPQIDLIGPTYITGTNTVSTTDNFFLDNSGQTGLVDAGYSTGVVGGFNNIYTAFGDVNTLCIAKSFTEPSSVVSVSSWLNLRGNGIYVDSIGTNVGSSVNILNSLIPSGGSINLGSSSNNFNALYVKNLFDGAGGGNITVHDDLILGSNKITSSYTPTGLNDVTNKTYVDGAISSGLTGYLKLDMSNSASISATMNTRSIVGQNNTYNIGSSGTYYAAGYITAIYGTLQTAAQTNITSLGNLTGLTLTGNLNTRTILPTLDINYNIGSISARYGNIYCSDLYTGEINIDPGFGGYLQITGAASSGIIPTVNNNLVLGITGARWLSSWITTMNSVTNNTTDENCVTLSATGSGTIGTTLSVGQWMATPAHYFTNGEYNLYDPRDNWYNVIRIQKGATSGNSAGLFLHSFGDNFDVGGTRQNTSEILALYQHLNLQTNSGVIRFLLNTALHGTWWTTGNLSIGNTVDSGYKLDLTGTCRMSSTLLVNGVATLANSLLHTGSTLQLCGTTVNSSNIPYLATMNQHIATTSGPSFSSLTIASGNNPNCLYMTSSNAAAYHQSDIAFNGSGGGVSYTGAIRYKSTGFMGFYLNSTLYASYGPTVMESITLDRQTALRTAINTTSGYSSSIYNSAKTAYIRDYGASSLEYCMTKLVFGSCGSSRYTQHTGSIGLLHTTDGNTSFYFNTSTTGMPETDATKFIMAYDGTLLVNQTNISAINPDFKLIVGGGAQISGKVSCGGEVAALTLSSTGSFINYGTYQNRAPSYFKFARVPALTTAWPPTSLLALNWTVGATYINIGSLFSSGGVTSGWSYNGTAGDEYMYFDTVDTQTTFITVTANVSFTVQYGYHVGVAIFKNASAVIDHSNMAFMAAPAQGHLSVSSRFSVTKGDKVYVKMWSSHVQTGQVYSFNVVCE